MVWLFIVLGAVAVVAVGLVVVGRVTAELAARPPVSTVDLDEAVLWVGDRLPQATTAEVSYSDVRAVLGWYLDYLTDKGVARSNDVAPLTSGPLVADEDEALAYVFGQLAASGDDAPVLTDAQVVEICDAQREYLVAIGAVRSIDAAG
jgi:hypothetical protein